MGVVLETEAVCDDLQGEAFGNEAPGEQLALNELDAQAALEALQPHVARTLVVGFSWGALVATRLVAARPPTTAAAPGLA